MFPESLSGLSDLVKHHGHVASGSLRAALDPGDHAPLGPRAPTSRSHRRRPAGWVRADDDQVLMLEGGLLGGEVAFRLGCVYSV
jgi:hypothetical protein